MGQFEQQLVKHSWINRIDYECEESWVAGISPIDGSGRASTVKKVTDKINNLKQFLKLLEHLHQSMSPLSLVVVVGEVVLVGSYGNKYDRDTSRGGD